MPEFKEFKLPDVGEGLVEAEIVTWKVKRGDEVKVNDIVVEIETAKSLVELPTPYAGVVADLLVNEGETIAVGTPFFVVDVDPDGAPAASAAPAPAATQSAAAGGPSAASLDEVVMPTGDEPIEPGLIGGPAPGGRTSVLVGYGPREGTGKRRPRTTDSAAVLAAAETAHEALQIAATPEPEPVQPPPVAELPTALPATPDAGSTAHVTVLAKPPVRKLAKDLGVDLKTVQAATGSGGVITRADVEAAATADPGAQHVDDSSGRGFVNRLGERETRIPIKGVRKMTAQAMVGSAFTAPHVTEFVTVDVTRTVKLVERLKSHGDFKDVRLSPLLVLARAMIIAIRRTPEINSTWDEATQEIVEKHYVNLGIAAATPRGLVVPNIKDADRMSLRELADALGELVATARAGKTQPAQMQQGTITITNVGVFGIDTGTPIINPGESAIVAFGAIREQPWVVKGKVRPRMVTTLAVSFDHRVVDGAGGSRFLADVGAILEDPAIALALS